MTRDELKNRELDRPTWDSYFMSIAYVVANRSIDPSTKHGCVIVDKNNTILGTGYNSPPRGMDDKYIPLTRPEKYDWIVHAEEAAIVNSASTGTKTAGSTIYITGLPCHSCSRMIVNAGCKRVVYGSVTSKCVTSSLETISNKMLTKANITVERISTDTEKEILEILNRTTERIL